MRNGGTLKKEAILAGILSFLLLAGVTPAEGSGSGYRLLKKIPLGGPANWDYASLDSKTRRLYVSHGDRVDVLDVDTEKVVGKVEDTRGVHGIALAPGPGRGFTSNGANSTCTIFDLKTLKTVNTVPTGQGPDAILYDALMGHVFTFDGEGETATVLKASTGKILSTLSLGGRPEFAVSDGQGHVFVNLVEKDVVALIDSKALKVANTWSLSSSQTPCSMAIDIPGKRLFVGCRDQSLVVLNSENGRFVARLPLGKGVDATVFDADTKFILSACGQGVLTVIRQDSPTHYTLVDNVPTLPGARTLALDTKTHRVYLPVVEKKKFEILVMGR